MKNLKENWKTNLEWFKTNNLSSKLRDNIIVIKLLCMEGTTIVVSNHLDRIGEVLIQEEMQRAKTIQIALMLLRKNV